MSIELSFHLPQSIPVPTVFCRCSLGDAIKGGLSDAADAVKDKANDLKKAVGQ